MNYFLALILPPLAVFLSGHKVQAVLSLVLFVLAIWTLYLADIGAFVGGYASGPVLYVLSVIHAFVFVHRQYQVETGKRHPHRGSAAQSKGSEDDKDAL
ncbi:YqaE/Pmp3 family membrane protein [Aliidiomarina sp. Khilg15.8]